MRLETGVRIGTYEIAGAIGAGGMGEVYRATDTSLGREVAIKVLPEVFAHDADRLARFEREARTLAALNHPNIAAVYGLDRSAGMPALILELVDGLTLADRITLGAISIGEALPIVRQIAQALEAAHERGIIHRDLKPSNVKVRSDGTVKVLDFGLAKLVEAPVRARSGTGPIEQDPTYALSPTITSPALITGAGLLLGTAAYMSPEQTKGRLVDKRSDIWAFGCVLYEMVTGKRPFAGESVPETLARVLEREPDWQALPSETPLAIRRVLQRCLAKDPARRMHDISDVRLEIDDVLSGGDPILDADDRSRRIGPGVVAVIAVAFLGGIVTGVLGTRFRTASPSSVLPPVRYTMPVEQINGNAVPVVSRDGRRIAFAAANAGGASSIWIQNLDEETPRELPGTSGGSQPFWSPDGRSLGFFADAALKRVELTGGSPQRIARADEPFGGTWSSSGIIVFAERYTLHQVPASGGTPVVVAGLDLTRQENSLRHPEFLPDGRHFLYVARSGRPENTSAYLASLDGSVPNRLFTTRSAVRYALPGTLLYVRDEALVAQPFDVERRALTGETRQIVGSIPANFIGPLDLFSVSETGVLAYRRPVARPWQLTWFDRSGKTMSLVGEPSVISTFRLSPDEGRVVFDEQARGFRSVWTLDFATGARSRLTFQGSDDWQPIWSPDGLRVLFGSYRNGPIDLYIKAASGGGSDEEFMRSPIQKGPRDWSRDGRFILFTQDTPEMKEDVLARDVSGSAPPIPIAVTAAREFDPRFSFDGGWVSYVSNETGTDEVYVQPFPPNGGKWQVSNGGGHSPRWRGDGRELFYLTPGGEMKVVPVAGGRSLVGGPPRTLFRVSGTRTGSPGSTSYEVTRDGQRFLVNVVKGSPQSSSISVMLNWTARP